MLTRCPEPAELLLCALQMPGDRARQETARHASNCASCETTIAGIREFASGLQFDPECPQTESCLDEMTVALVVDDCVDVAERPELIAHLSGCSRCRENVSSVAGLLRDQSLAVEMDSIDRPLLVPPLGRRWRLGGVGALAAIAATAVLMARSSGNRPIVSQPMITATPAETNREQSVTTTVAPRLIAPIGAAAVADTFRWTGVPRADRYRVTIFDRDGKTIWEAEARDTLVAPPVSIVRSLRSEYLWKVEARTGWDSWVASELVDVSITSGRM